MLPATTLTGKIMTSNGRRADVAESICKSRQQQRTPLVDV